MKKVIKSSKILLRAIIVMLIGLFTVQSLLAQDWYNTNWSYRIPVTITNSGSALTDYQVQVTLGGSFNWSNVQDDGDDIRFTTSDGETEIDYWIESWDDGTSAIIWVEVTSIAASPTTTTIYLYYGNSSATGASDGEETFDFFDGFDSGSDVDTEKWTYFIGDETMTSVAGGLLTMTTDVPSAMESSYVRINGDVTFLNGYVIETLGEHPDAGTRYLIIESGFSDNDFKNNIRLMDYWGTTDKWEINTRNGGSTGPYDTMDDDADTDWHQFKVYRNTSGTVSFQIDESTVEDYDHPTYVPDDEYLSPFLISYSNVASTTNTFIVDWTRVRKWDEDADPTTALGTQQGLITWTGDTDTDWSDSYNWSPNQVPGSTSLVIIADVDNDPVISDLDPEIQGLTINSSASLTIDPDGTLTINGELVNNGTLNLNSSSSGIASLMVDSYSGSGINNIQLYLTGDDVGTGWHYISPPVSIINATVFSNRTNTAIARYNEALITTNDEDNGWVTSTGYHFNSSTGQWEGPGTGWTLLSAGKGYYYYGATTTPSDPDDSNALIINGTINTADVNANLLYNSDGGSSYTANGWNLVGNPFTCGLDWDLVVSDPDNNGLWSVVETAIYFRSNGVLYAYNHVSVPTYPGYDGSEIPPMQGFFVKASAALQTLTLGEEAKIHTNHPRYKSKPVMPMVRLEIENTGMTDQTVIIFNENANFSYDNFYDARKLFAPKDAPYINSSLDGTAYAINTIPFPEDADTIPLVINASNEGQYTIEAVELIGLDNYKIYLLDKDQNFTTDLSDNNLYSFASSTGKFTDRFVLIVSSIVTGINESIISDKPFNIYTSMGLINVQTLSDVWNGKKGDIKVFDMTGRLISNFGNITFHQDEVRQFPANGESGIYVVQINSGQMRYVNKVFIK